MTRPLKITLKLDLTLFTLRNTLQLYPIVNSLDQVCVASPAGGGDIVLLRPGQEHGVSELLQEGPRLDDGVIAP